MTLVEMIERFGGVERSIAVLNRTEPDPIRNILVETFGDDHVDVGEVRTAAGGGSNDSAESGSAGSESGASAVIDALVGDAGVRVELDELRIRDSAGLTHRDLRSVENLVVLIEDDEIVATSPLEELLNAILLVNSDLYITGARSLDELDLPDVLTALDDTVFTLRGYPESNRQKLLLITISRFVERAAWLAGEGTLRSSFQRLSRLDDEVGTREVYEQVPEAGVETHVYGVADRFPTDLDVEIHAGETQDYTDSWFVVFRPPNGPRDVPSADTDLERGVEGGVALLAVETEPRLWRGVWTFDPERVERLDEYVRTTL